MVVHITSHCVHVLNVKNVHCIMVLFVVYFGIAGHNESQIWCSGILVQTKRTCASVFIGLAAC